MTAIFKIAALLLVVAIVVVCVSPLIDLDPTTMRALRAAQALVSALAWAAFLIISFSVPPGTDRVLAPCEAAVPVPDDLLNRNCARLC